MKVVCIKKYHSQGLQHELTYGKVYETVRGLNIPSIDDFNYWIINDRGQREYYSKNTFLKLDEWRKRQLSKILI
jgi:flagellar basal body rod protein FlgF